MNGIAVLLVMAAVGVDYGWQPDRDGQLEYIIQIEPSLLDSLKGGREIISEIHPDAHGVRRFRIRVGTGPVPREASLQPQTTPKSFTIPNSPQTPGPGVSPAAVESGPRLLSLPPPPSFDDSDGKSSVLVPPRQGLRDSTSNPPAANQPSGNRPVADPATRFPILNLPPPPDLDEDLDNVAGVATKANDEGGIEKLPPAPTRGFGWPLRDGLSKDGPSEIPRIKAPATTLTWPAQDIVSAPDDDIPPRPIPSPKSRAGFPLPIRAMGRESVADTATKAVAIEPPETNRRTTPPSQDRRSREDLTTSIGSVASNFDKSAAATQKPTIDEETAKQLEEEPPWLPLILTSLALFASLAANLYLGWVAIGIYRRYRDVVDQLHHAQATAA